MFKQNKSMIICRLSVAGSVLLLAACAVKQDPSRTDYESLKSDRIANFESEQALLELLKRYERLHQPAVARTAPDQSGVVLEEIVVTARNAVSTDITNNQEAGVIESDIVKFTGEHFVILRQGRLHTVRLSDGPVPLLIEEGVLDAASPGLDHDAWYDAILTRGERVVVIAYNYDADATQLLFFDLDSSTGKLSRGAGYFIRSADYFSGENYPARLVGDQLLVYAPIPLRQRYGRDDSIRYPQIATIHPVDDVDDLDWQPLVQAEDITQPLQVSWPPTAHAFISCPLSNPARCQAKAVLGGSRTEYYVAPNNIYLWSGSFQPESYWHLGRLTTPYYLSSDEAETDDLIYRISLTNDTVDAVSVDGKPSNQFVFAERQGDLFALLENREGSHANLVHAASNQFNTDGSQAATPIGDFPLHRNTRTRFAAEHMLLTNTDYSSEFEGPAGAIVYSQALFGGQADEFLLVDHGVDRLELLDQGAFVLGEDYLATLRGTTLAFEQQALTQVDTLKFPGIEEAESRSHAFNFARMSSGDGYLGFTAHDRELAELCWDDAQCDEPPTDLRFVRVDQQLNLQSNGSVIEDVDPTKQCEDCEVDWYGNARVFFVGDRVFALSGDQLSEVDLSSGDAAVVRQIELTHDQARD